MSNNEKIHPEVENSQKYTIIIDYNHMYIRHKKVSMVKLCDVMRIYIT